TAILDGEIVADAETAQLIGAVDRMLESRVVTDHPAIDPDDAGAVRLKIVPHFEFGRVETPSLTNSQIVLDYDGGRNAGGPRPDLEILLDGRVAGYAVAHEARPRRRRGRGGARGRRRRAAGRGSGRLLQDGRAGRLGSGGRGRL